MYTYLVIDDFGKATNVNVSSSGIHFQKGRFIEYYLSPSETKKYGSLRKQIQLSWLLKAEVLISLEVSGSRSAMILTWNHNQDPSFSIVLTELIERGNILISTTKEKY